MIAPRTRDAFSVRADQRSRSEFGLVGFNSTPTECATQMIGLSFP
jgi:hypothetical protein